MRKDDLRGLASEIGYSREDAWKHAVLIRENNLASFGAKLTMTGAVAPLFLCSRGPALHAAEKYVRDFGIPEDEDGIPYFVKINSTLIRNPSQAYKKRCKYSWDTLMCPYGLFVLQSGSELICEICRGYQWGGQTTSPAERLREQATYSLVVKSAPISSMRERNSWVSTIT
ncbi:MAG: hypothetical protein QMD78_04450 [Methanocellales archaeon]|nr:hypothetical protein [Methanocellales archaeon]